MNVVITHFAELELNTVSIEGVKQVYRNQLGFPVVDESGGFIRFQPTPHVTLTFREVYEPISPAHIAFEVPYSQFDAVVRVIRNQMLLIARWADGREVHSFEGGKNIYFRDGDGHLLEIISHSYIREDVLAPHGALNVIYLREVGFPADDVTGFREWLKSTLHLRTKEESDTFNFVVGGTAHAIVSSVGRKECNIRTMKVKGRPYPGGCSRSINCFSFDSVGESGAGV
ncbi:hypothetical protein ACFQI7_03640 [Paenibacillus allorhizosphaerae]|uniref:VOC domain-containing protein n=1 Tax=Paenibacillus allorhizosphaerae TaxID=2849866 RepID=A0ABN7TDD3_9BACL|nr:hypothetical protein [Paenibacillus allorhizosphaerae]CAG7624779.1 hypothetical protein PAECIP111802_01099 [Paenibacillus allorhizosphaerae]